MPSEKVRSLCIRKAVVEAPEGGLRAVRDFDLAQQTLEVDLDGRLGDPEVVGDYFVGAAIL